MADILSLVRWAWGVNLLDHFLCLIGALMVVGAGCHGFLLADNAIRENRARRRDD